MVVIGAVFNIVTPTLGICFSSVAAALWTTTIKLMDLVAGASETNNFHTDPAALLIERSRNERSRNERRCTVPFDFAQDTATAINQNIFSSRIHRSKY